MAIESFRALIHEFGARLGAADIEADQDGYIALLFDGHPTHLQYDAETDGIVAFARLGEVEGDRSEQIYLMLLGANLFWQGTKGATFSIEPATGVVFLAERRAMDASGAEGLNSWLEHFLDIAGYWRNRLAAVNAGGGLENGVSNGFAPEPAGPGSFIRG